MLPCTFPGFSPSPIATFIAAPAVDRQSYHFTSNAIDARALSDRAVTVTCSVCGPAVAPANETSASMRRDAPGSIVRSTRMTSRPPASRTTMEAVARIADVALPHVEADTQRRTRVERAFERRRERQRTAVGATGTGPADQKAAHGHALRVERWHVDRQVRAAAR